MAKVSVVVPVYNVEKYLPQCIESIQNQTLKDWELILVNDGSLDNSGNICDEYASKDNRIRVIHKENGGVSAARNIGVYYSEGDYVAFVDSDDYISLNMFEKMVDVIAKTGSDMVKCGFSEFISNKVTKSVTFKDEIKIINNNSQGNDLLGYYFEGVLHTVCWNTLYTRELVRKVIFPEGFIAEDNYTSGMYLYHARRITLINDILYFYRQTGNGVNFTAHNKRKIDFVLSTSKLYEDLRELGLQDDVFYLELRKKIARNIFHCARQKKYLTIDQAFYKFVMNHLSIRRKCQMLIFKMLKFFKVKN